ncbi:MAG: glutamyl-tRNA reductase, partial [Actinomycetales bacterium]|nr:glutamyl-tRNA reductase [Actinomycetales bacterium]
MPILALAARHHQVGLETLERLSARPAAVRRAVLAACPGVRGVVVLATCNRFELYLDVADGGPRAGRTPRGPARVETEGADDDAHAVTEAVAQTLGLLLADVRATLALVSHPVAHLCAVAAGLDSMVLGEREIAGQVRRAAAESRVDGAMTGALERLVSAASRAARQVATETSLGALGRSVVDVALDAAGLTPSGARPAGTRTEADPSMLTRCVLVGTGSYAGAVVAALARRGVRHVDVFSATGRAAEFAEPRGLGVLSTPEELTTAIAAADLVITCSGSGTVLGPEHFAGAPSTPPLAVVDLALRRDVDPAVGDLTGVRLVTLRDLAGLAPGLGAEDLTRARMIVDRIVADLAGADRALAWGRDLAAARRRTLDAHPPHARRRLHAALHPASARAHAAARAGDRRA